MESDFRVDTLRDGFLARIFDSGLSLGKNKPFRDVFLDLARVFLAENSLLQARNTVHILQMSAQITTLCKSFLAFGAAEGSRACVLPEVIPQVATLLEGAGASCVFTFEEKLDALRDRVLHLNRLMPLRWNAFEVFILGVIMRFNPVFRIHALIVVRVTIKVHALVHDRLLLSSDTSLSLWLCWHDVRLLYSVGTGSVLSGSALCEEIVQLAKHIELLGGEMCREIRVWSAQFAFLNC